MIKGAQKRMVIVKTADSELFEEAHFVMRREEGGSKGDILREANRIIEESCGRRGRREHLLAKHKLACSLLFLSGGAAGSLLTFLGLLAFWL